MVECEYMKKSENNKKSVSFNRYMVECECGHPSPLAQRIQVLIDTWWNVNISV